MQKPNQKIYCSLLNFWIEHAISPSGTLPSCLIFAFASGEIQRFPSKIINNYLLTFSLDPSIAVVDFCTANLMSENDIRKHETRSTRSCPERRARPNGRWVRCSLLRASQLHLSNLGAFRNGNRVLAATSWRLCACTLKTPPNTKNYEPTPQPRLLEAPPSLCARAMVWVGAWYGRLTGGAT